MRFSTHGRLRSVSCVALTLALIVSSAGCSTMRVVSVPATEPPSPHIEEPVYGLTTSSGDEVMFDGPGEVRVGDVAVADLERRSSLDADRATVNGTVAGAPYEIPLREVETLSVKRPHVNAALTWGAVGGVVGFFVIISLLFAET